MTLLHAEVGVEELLAVIHLALLAGEIEAAEELVKDALEQVQVLKMAGLTKAVL